MAPWVQGTVREGQEVIDKGHSTLSPQAMLKQEHHKLSQFNLSDQEGAKGGGGRSV